MENENVFMTNPGYCHILDDKIVFSEQIELQSYSQIGSKNKINQVRIKNLLILVLCLFLAYKNFSKNENIFTIVLIFSSLIILTRVLISYNESTSNQIFRDKITLIKFKKSILGIFGSRFVVYFIDENGETKKRFIYLPGFYNNGKKETEKALTILRREKLINF